MGRRAADVQAFAAEPGQLGSQGLEAVDAALKDGQRVGVQADFGAALLDAAIERGRALVAMEDAFRVELAVVVGGCVVEIVRRAHADRPLHSADLRRGQEVVVDVVANGDPQLVLRRRRKQAGERRDLDAIVHPQRQEQEHVLAQGVGHAQRRGEGEAAGVAQGGNFRRIAQPRDNAIRLQGAHSLMVRESVIDRFDDGLQSPQFLALSIHFLPIMGCSFHFSAWRECKSWRRSGNNRSGRS